MKLSDLARLEARHGTASADREAVAICADSICVRKMFGWLGST